MTELGPYSIVETVATRAFTVTYRAEQRGVGRTVLVKTTKQTVPVGSPWAAALEREAAVLGRLDHEAIPRLFDLTHTRDALWLVTEDVRGPTLAEVLAAARVGVDPATAIGIAIARGLGHAHERGVVHCGLGSAVVRVTASGCVKLADLSSARVIGAEITEDPEPLEAGETFARADYMSPEQILGEPAGPRSDVWALGVVLFELYAGAKPFDASDRRAVAQRIRTGAPAALPAEVPRSLERVVSRCLAKSPDDRYEDARAVAAALEEALASLSRLPVPVLVTRALAAAKLGEALPVPGGSGALPREALAIGPSALRAARPLGIVLALIVAGAVLLQVTRDPDTAADASGVAEGLSVKGKGLLRVVAKPWAEVFVDGDLVDVTPIGRPILLAPGKHYVSFRHPQAPDEQRSIKIAAGQTVLLDVTMRVIRADAGAKKDADAGESP